MSTPAPRVSLADLKAALAGSIDANGLRATARELGMSPMGTQKLAKTTAAPDPPTLKKLTDWYWAFHVPREAAVTKAAVRAALAPLVRHMPPRRRENAVLRMLNALASETRHPGLPLPDWLAAFFAAWPPPEPEDDTEEG